MTTQPPTMPNKPTADGDSYAEFLHQITLDLLRRQDIGALLVRIVEHAATLLDAPYGAILLYEGHVLVARASTSNLPYLVGDQMQRGEAPNAWRAFDSHEPVVVDDYGVWLWAELRGIYEAVTLTAVAGFPILNGEQCLGVLTMARNVPNSPFCEQDKERGMQFSQLAALVLDNAQLHATAAQELAERKEAERTLNQLYQVMATPHATIAEQLTHALKVGTELLGLPVSVISRIEDDDYLILYAYTADGVIQPGQHFPFHETTCEITYQTGGLLAIEHMGKSIYRSHPCYTTYGIEAYVGIPLYVEGKRFGTLNFSNTAVRPIPFTQAEKEFLLLMGQWVSTQLAQQLAIDKLEASEAQQRATLAAIPDLLFRFDELGTYLFYQAPHKELLIASPERFLGHNMADVLPPNVATQFAEVLKTVFITGQPTNFEYQLDLPHGTMDFEGRLVLVNEQEALALIRDITERKQSERVRQQLVEELTQLTAEQKIILDNTAASIFLQQDTHIIWANPATEKLLGYSQAEIATLPNVAYHISPEAHAQFSHTITPPLAQGEVITTEIQIRRQNGSTCWVTITGQALNPQRVHEDGVLWIMQDITERKEAEERLRDSQQFLETVLNTLTAHVVIVDEEGVITKTNESWRNYAKANGLTWDDYGLGRNYLQVLAAVEGDGLEDADTVLTGIQRVLKGQVPSYSYTYPCHSPSEQSWYTMEATRLARPEGLHLVLAHHNVTKPILDEAELYKTKTFLSTVLELAPIAISTFNMAHEFHSVNRQWELNRQLGREQAIGRSITELLPPDLAQKYLDDHAWVVQNGVLTQEESAETPYGRRWFQSIQFPLHNPNGAVEFVGRLALDITEHKTAEAILHTYANQLAIAHDQALEASHYKTLLLNKVSHELRTPLSGILGYAELLRDGMGGKLLPDQAEFVSQIVFSIHHLNSLISDLLDQAQIEQGTLKLQEHPIVVPDMVKFLHSLLTPFAVEKGLELIFESQMPEAIMGDEKRLRQIIINLANNALKFTETGMVSIQLVPVDSISWRIDVTDTGPGIAPEVQSRIFDSFWQVDGSTNSLHKGYGLGLSIVKNLTHLMHGRVEVESTPGEGSTFTVWLPLEIL